MQPSQTRRVRESESGSQEVRESFSIAVEPVWIMAGSRSGGYELPDRLDSRRRVSAACGAVVVVRVKDGRRKRTMTLSVLPPWLSRRKRRSLSPQIPENGDETGGNRMSHRQEGLVTVGLAWLQMPDKPPRKASGDKAPGPSTPCHFFPFSFFFFFSSTSASGVGLRDPVLRKFHDNARVRNTIWAFSEGPSICIVHASGAEGRGPRGLRADWTRFVEMK